MAEAEATSRKGSEAHERRDYIIEVVLALLLGSATVMGAICAFQAARWSAETNAAYTQGTNKLGAANRELLKASQEQSFDAVVWMEALKAAEASNLAAVLAGEGGEEGEEGADEAPEPETVEAAIEARAEAIAEGLMYRADMPLAEKLQKLVNTRKDLKAALAWTEKEYSRRVGGLSEQDFVKLVVEIMQLEEARAGVEAEMWALLQPLGLSEEAWEDDDEQAIVAILTESPEAAETFQALEAKWIDAQTGIDRAYDKVSRPLFFESPAYKKRHQAAYKALMAEGTALINEGQAFTKHGGGFTRLTVFFAITLFFAGLGAVMRKVGIKVTFLVMSAGTLTYALIGIFSLPFA